MYTANLELNKNVYVGTLDFYVLVETQKILRNLNRSLTIQGIFEGLAGEDMEIISTLVLQSVLRCNNNIKDIMHDYTIEKTDMEIIEYFIAINTFLMELLQECMPKTDKASQKDEFEDIPDFEETKDWDIDEMEYIWSTTIKRQDFWSTTPKNFFKQMDIHIKFNKQDAKDDVKTEEL